MPGACGKVQLFWGEQQAVVAFVAAACIFFRMPAPPRSHLSLTTWGVLCRID